MRCIDKVKKHFDVKKWQINQPIILSDIAYQISLCKGVASVVPPVEDNPEKSMVLIETLKILSGLTTITQMHQILPIMDHLLIPLILHKYLQQQQTAYRELHIIRK